jgi:hypothetical protein
MIFDPLFHEAFRPKTLLNYREQHHKGRVIDPKEVRAAVSINNLASLQRGLKPLMVSAIEVEVDGAIDMGRDPITPRSTDRRVRR